MKDPVKRMETQATYWENVFVSHMSDKGLLSRMYKDLSKLNSKKKIRKWAKDINIHLTEENTQMTNKHIKGYSASLIVMEMQINTTVRYNCTPIRLTKIKKVTTLNAGEDTKKLDHSYIAGKNVKWSNDSGKSSDSFL